MTRATVTPLLTDINNAKSNNFNSVPVLGNKKGKSWAQRLLNRYDIETVVYMIEPWERMLVRAVLVLFVVSILHFITFGSPFSFTTFFNY